MSSPAGFGAEARKFLKFKVSFTSEDLFWQILEKILGVLLQKFSANEGRFAICDRLLPSLVCVWTRTPHQLFPMRVDSVPLVKSAKRFGTAWFKSDKISQKCFSGGRPTISFHHLFVFHPLFILLPCFLINKIEKVYVPPRPPCWDSVKAGTSPLGLDLSF